MEPQEKQEMIIELRGLEGGVAPQLKGIQIAIAPHVDVLVVMWWAVFFAVCVCMVGYVMRTYLHEKKRTNQDS